MRLKGKGERVFLFSLFISIIIMIDWGLVPRMRSASGAGELHRKKREVGLEQTVNAPPATTSLARVKSLGGGRVYPTLTLLKQLRCCSSLPKRWRYLLAARQHENPPCEYDAILVPERLVGKEERKWRWRSTSDLGGHGAM